MFRSTLTLLTGLTGADGRLTDGPSRWSPSSNINFVAFSRYVQHGIDGQIMAAFVIVLAAAEAAVALAIVLAMFRNFGTANADTVQNLQR